MILSLSLFLIQPVIKSCQFSFHYKPCLITSHHFTITTHPRLQGVSLVAQLVKNLPARREIWLSSLGWEDPLEKENGYPLQYSGLENSMDMGSQGAGQDCATFTFTRLQGQLPACCVPVSSSAPCSPFLTNLPQKPFQPGIRSHHSPGENRLMPSHCTQSLPYNLASFLAPSLLLSRLHLQ